MKKILFGSAAAICTVVGLSSFKHANTNTAQYYIFQTTDALVHTVIPGQSPAQNVVFERSMVSNFLGIETLNTDASGVISSSTGCLGGPDWCAAAFLHSQVNTIVSGFQLKTVSGVTAQQNEKFAKENDD